MVKLPEPLKNGDSPKMHGMAFPRAMNIMGYDNGWRDIQVQQTI
jgi:hypothetical protein